MKNISTNFTLYRGSYQETSQAKRYIGRKPTYMRNDPPLYFTYGSNGKNIATNAYGPVVTYKTTKPIKLLEISKQSTFKNLYNKATDNEKFALSKAFRYMPNGKIVRFSKTKYDFPIARMVCRLGYDGYIHPKLFKKYQENKVNPRFHQEIVLCKPKDILKVSNVTKLQSNRSVSPRTPIGTPKGSPRTPIGTPKGSPRTPIGTPKGSPRTPIGTPIGFPMFTPAKKPRVMRKL